MISCPGWLVSRCAVPPVVAAVPAAPVAPAAPVVVPAAVPAAEPTPPVLKDEPKVEAVAPADPDGPRPYVAATLPAAGTPEDFLAAAALRVLREQATKVLTVEAPIVFDRLCRTLAVAWDLARLTDRVRERIRSALPPGTVVQDDVVWPFRVPRDGEEAERSAEELPVVEIGNAMVWLLRQHQALAVDDLAREAARCFGITRLGAVVKEVMAGVVERLVGEGRVVRDGEVVRLG